MHWYSNLDTVLVLAKQQLKLSNSINDKVGIIKAHIDYWHVYNEQQLFVEAIQAGIEILRGADGLDSDKYRAVALSNLGLTYYQMGENNLAVDYFQKAMKIDSLRGDIRGLASDYNNLSLAYFSQGKFRSALQYSLEAFSIHDSLKNEVGCAIAKLNAANSYSRLGQKTEAQKNIQEALNYSLRSNDKEGQAYAYNYMVMFSEGKLSPRQEIDLVQKSLDISRQLGLSELTRDNYQRLSYSYEKMNQLAKALYYQRVSTNLSDTLYSTNKRVEAAKLNARYQLEKNEMEILSLKESMKFKEQSAIRQKWIFVLVAFFALAIASFIWIYQRTASKVRFANMEAAHMRKELSYLKEQTNPHFLLNALNSLYGISLTKPNLVAEKISELSYLLHYQLSSTKMETVDLNDEINFTKRYIEFKKSKIHQLNVNLEVVGDFSERFLPPLLFFPLIENALKYSAETDKPFVSIRWQIETDRIVLMVFNNFDLASSASGGTKIGIENLTKRLNLYHYNFDLQTGKTEELYKVQLHLWDRGVTNV